MVGFVLRKVCDNSRAGSSNEKIKGMTIIMSWKVDVPSEMEIIKDARKIVRGSKIRVSMNIEVTTDDELIYHDLPGSIHEDIVMDGHRQGEKSIRL